MQKTILIVGGGYAGVAAAKGLMKRRIDARIIFVDQHSYQALPSDFYELATVNLSERKSIDWERLKRCATVPFAEIFKGNPIEIRKDSLERVYLNRHVCVFTRHGEQPYDYLLLAIGAETNFYDIPRLQEYCHGFKTISDVLGARNAVDELFARKAKHEPIHIIVGGGGFTGCEVAAELIGFINKLADQHGHPRSSLSVTIVEAGATLLPGGSAWLQTAAKKRLEALGVRLIFKKPIQSVTEFEALFDGHSLPYDILFWTAGVKANLFFDQWIEVKKEKGGRVAVDQTLRIPECQNVFILGDAAYCANPATGKSEPMTGQTALHHGKYAARTIADLLKNRPPDQIKRTGSPARVIWVGPPQPYRHKKPLLLVPLGGTYALLDLGWIRVRGIFGWILKRAALLRYLLSILPLSKALSFWLATTRLFTKND